MHADTVKSSTFIAFSSVRAIPFLIVRGDRMHLVFAPVMHATFQGHSYVNMQDFFIYTKGLL